jgi:RNA polymerase sigma factor (sigma-70 family)
MPSPPSPQAASAPAELSRLLSASERVEQEKAWSEFVTSHNRILLHTCRAVAHDHDAAMDGYAYVLEALREDGYRRLRAYVPRGTTRFTTWLVVVVRRLLLDHYRHRYGRPRSGDASRRDENLARRRLEDLVAVELDPDQLTASSTSPDLGIQRQELTELLRQALGELAPADRLLLALRFEDERPAQEIAATMQLPTVFHVYRRVAAALGQLKRALARRGVKEAEP